MTTQQEAGPKTGASGTTARLRPAGVPAEAVVWAMRLFAGRDPVDDAEIAFHQQHGNLDSLRTAFTEFHEFEQFYARVKGRKKTFGAPPFLLRPPSDPAIPWRFEQPTLETPVCQLCTASQFEEPAFHEIVAALATQPSRHRRLWETVYIISVLASEGMIAPGKRALGFGCSRQRIPSLLASRGVEVLATDAPPEQAPGQGRAGSQYAAKALDVFYPEIIHIEDFEQLVTFHPVDMTAIPAELDGQFDCCWSAGALEHLGSLDHGLDFVANSLATLRPGGVAVHTTGFNLGSDAETLETPSLSIHRRRDIERLILRLAAQGHEVLPLNLHPGHDPIDAAVDLPPYGLPHLKLMVGETLLTSFGLVIRKAG